MTPSLAGWRLLLTRPQEDCVLLAQTLAAQGVFSSCMPLLEIAALEEDATQRALILDLDRYQAVIVVSKPAARLGLALLNRYWPQPPALRWFTVGAASAAILQECGLDVLHPQSGDDSEALLRLPALQTALQTALARLPARVLIMRGDEGREMLAERLRTMGVTVDYLPLYRRCLPQYPTGELLRRVSGERLNGLVVSSGQGFEHLRTLAGAAWSELARLPLFVPSPRVAGLAQDAGALNIVDCRGASAAALLAALRDSPAPAVH